MAGVLTQAVGCVGKPKSWYCIYWSHVTLKHKPRGPNQYLKRGGKKVHIPPSKGAWKSTQRSCKHSCPGQLLLRKRSVCGCPPVSWTPRVGSGPAPRPHSSVCSAPWSWTAHTGLHQSRSGGASRRELNQTTQKHWTLPKQGKMATNSLFPGVS